MLDLGERFHAERGGRKHMRQSIITSPQPPALVGSWGTTAG